MIESWAYTAAEGLWLIELDPQIRKCSRDPSVLAPVREHHPDSCQIVDAATEQLIQNLHK